MSASKIGMVSVQHFDFAARQQLRAEEIAAVEKAMQINHKQEIVYKVFLAISSILIVPLIIK